MKLRNKDLFRKNLGVGIFGLFLAVACGTKLAYQSSLKEAWNSSNDPLRLSRAYERSFTALPKQAKLESTPWTDTYWPTFEAGISARWNQPNANHFNYKSPDLNSLRAYSLSQMAQLSPAEKYDIYRGRYDYPLVKSERNRTSPSAASWEGICHGWAPAAYLYKEPQPVTLKNRDGIEVSFGSSDVKALLSYYTGQVSQAESRILGSRCNVDLKKNPEAASDPACRDTNAGSFHVVLANQIGVMKKSFVADVTRDLQVWNQPIFGYKTETTQSRPPSVGSAPGTQKEIQVVTQMSYTVEVEPNWKALNGTSGFAKQTEEYVYWLELDAQDNIIGGTWITEDRPDFVWSQSIEAFAGEFKDLEKLYKASTNQTPDPIVTPTARPTAFPTPVATPTAMPTEQPTPVATPTEVPTPIINPTVITTPVPNPGVEALQCPQGSQVLFTAALSAYCADGASLIGPFPETLVEKCINDFHEFCNLTKWPLKEGLALRGNKLCMEGTMLDPLSGFCSDKASALGPQSLYGPFTGNLISKCISYGGGGACNLMRWDRNFTLSLMAKE